MVRVHLFRSFCSIPGLYTSSNLRGDVRPSTSSFATSPARALPAPCRRREPETRAHCDFHSKWQFVEFIITPLDCDLRDYRLLAGRGPRIRRTMGQNPRSGVGGSRSEQVDLSSSESGCRLHSGGLFASVAVVRSAGRQRQLNGDTT